MSAPSSSKDLAHASVPKSNANDNANDNDSGEESDLNAGISTDEESETVAAGRVMKPAALEAGSWECPVCEVMNPPSVLKCRACETPQPGSEATAAAAGAGAGGSDAPLGVTFGVPSSTAVPFTVPTAFNFGANPSAPPGAATNFAAFSFGNASTEKK